MKKRRGKKGQQQGQEIKENEIEKMDDKMDGLREREKKNTDEKE